MEMPKNRLLQTLCASYLQRFLCCGLPNQPASELIEGTAGVWASVIEDSEVTLADVRNALDWLIAHADHWPTPADITARLRAQNPPLAAPYHAMAPVHRALPKPSGPQSAGRIAAVEIDKLRAQLGLPKDSL